MVLTVGDDVGGHFQGSGCISKYGNIAKNNPKITEKSEKNGGWCSLLVTTSGVIFRVQDACPNMVIWPKIARKEPKNQKKMGDGVHC